MANYTKATNFTVKDTLTSGDPNKIVKGTEIDTEFIAIASAISSKADLASPAFTGVPTAPTALSTTNTAQIATTAFVQSVITGLNLGNMSTQNKTAVDITGGTIAGVTITGGTVSGLSSPLAVADGGTGATSFTANRILIGNGTGAIQTLAPGATGTVLKSDGTTFTSQQLGLGMSGEVWNNVTGSRGFGVTYTNSRSYPIMVSASTNYTAGSQDLVGYVNGTQVAFWKWQFNGAGAVGGTTFIVPPGATYFCSPTVSVSGLMRWMELY